MSEVTREEHMQVAQTVVQQGAKMSTLQDLVKSNATSINRLDANMSHMEESMENIGKDLSKKIDQINNRGQMSPAMLISILTVLFIAGGGLLTAVLLINKPTAVVAMTNQMELQEYRREAKQEAYNNGVRDTRLDAHEQYIKLIDQRGSRHLVEEKGQ